jgi:hypothetical protein
MFHLRLTTIALILLTTWLASTPFRAAAQGGRTSRPTGKQTGDVFATNTGGNRTRTTGTQGVNHGNGGNKTCKTTKNTPNYNPNTCTSGDIVATNGNPGNKPPKPPAPTPSPKPTPPPVPAPPPTRPLSYCVDLKTSEFLVDQLVQDKAQTDFNCHYYTKTFIRQALPTGWTDGAMSLIREQDLKAAGYQRVKVEYDEQRRIRNAQVGDVLLLEGNTGTFSPYLHSAIVTRTDANGTILSLRQKLNPQDCVAETDWEPFQKAFLSHSTGIKLWTNPKRAGSLERRQK